MSTATLKGFRSLIFFSENGKSTFKSGHPARIIFKARKELNMQKDYETFVEKLEIGIYEATGIPRKIFLLRKKAGGLRL